MQKMPALHQSSANESVLIILTLLQSASKDAVYCSEGQIKKTGRKKSAWMKWFVDYNSQHITVEFWFTLKKNKKQIHTRIHVYIKALKRIF